MQPRRNVKGLGLATIIILGTNVLATLLFAIAQGRRHTLVSQMLDSFNGNGDGPALSDVQASDNFVHGAALLYSITFIACIVLVICWFYAARTNAETYSSYSPTLSRGWAVGGWFIPLANYVLPVIVAADIHRGTTAREPLGHGRKPSAGVLTGFWWAAWVLSNIVFVIAMGDSGAKDHNTDDPYHKLHSLQTSSEQSLPSLVLLMAAAVLGAIWIGRISKIQTARAGEPYGGAAYGMPAFGPGGAPGGYGMMPGAPAGYGPPMPTPVPYGAAPTQFAQAPGQFGAPQPNPYGPAAGQPTPYAPVTAPGMPQQPYPTPTMAAVPAAPPTMPEAPPLPEPMAMPTPVTEAVPARTLVADADAVPPAARPAEPVEDAVSAQTLVADAFGAVDRPGAEDVPEPPQ